jgi:uncharacterized protein YbjT (DUF2867 family)
MAEIKTVLVTRATGFIGAHVVDELLKRGVTVKASTRSLAKAERMEASRPQYVDRLHFVQVADFTDDTDFSEAVEGVDAIVHTASVSTIPLGYGAMADECSRSRMIQRTTRRSSFFRP